MRALQKAVDRVAVTLSAALLTVMMVVLAYNVLARFLGGGISWYMEFSQYANVWAMLIVGVGICAYGQHLRINALETILKGKWKVANRIIVSLATIAFYLLFAYGTYLLATKAKQSISTMPALRMSYVYWLMPVCGMLSALSSTLHAVIDVQDLLAEGAEQ